MLQPGLALQATLSRTLPGVPIITTQLAPVCSVAQVALPDITFVSQACGLHGNLSVSPVWLGVT